MSNSSGDAGEDGPSPGFYRNLELYAKGVWTIHPYISLTICAFGILTNIINIIILTRKNMRNPINCILTGIAVSDILTMLDYIPFAVHFYIATDLHDLLARYTYGWSTYLAVHSCLSNTTHTISIWLAVCMSVIRYVFIRTRGKRNLTIQSTVLLIALVYFLSIFVFIPNYIVTEVDPVFMPQHNTTIYRIKNLVIYFKNSTVINTINVWSFIIIGKVFPCFLISLFGGLLLRTLGDSKRLSESLKQTQCSQRMRAHKRTTIMLLIIILMFIIAELPSAILVIVSAFVEGFFMDYYMLFADTLDILSLVNNAVNFVMYCSMSRQFRDILWESLPQCSPDKRGKYTKAACTKAATSVTRL